jgi:hypothetical protein
MVRFGSLLLVSFLFAANAFSQGVFGSIEGTLTDDSGAVVPAVKVVARNVETGLTFTSESNEAGIFLLGQLRPGRYDVTAEKQGFSTFAQKGVTLRVNDQIRLDIQMKVGQVSERVEVAAEAPLVQSEKSIIGKVVEERAIKELPLAGRSAFSLILLTPGTQQTVVNSGTSADPQPRLSGGRTRNGEFTIDGTSATDPRRGDTVVSPNLDALQEFSVQTTGISAEFGRLSGGVVNAALKSGTNQFHGNLFEFSRNAAFDARNFFSATVPHHVYNQFGGMIGGPIVRDRTFFFVDYQGTRNRQESVFNLTLPTPQEIRGDFSQILGRQIGTDALGRGINQDQIFDPSTTRLANGQQVRDPFPGNIIPVTRFDPAGAKVASLYPAPNRPGLTQNFYVLSSGGLNEDQFDVRVDHRLSEKDLSFLRLSFDRQDNITARPYPNSATNGTVGEIDPFWTTALNWVHTITPTTISELRFGSMRAELNRVLAQRDIGSLGLQNVPPGHLPNFTNPGYDNLGDLVVRDPTEEQYQVQELLTLVRGRHIFKVGADFRRFRINDLQLLLTQFQLSRNQTGSPSNLAATGNPIASLLLGVASYFQTDPNQGRFYQRSNYLGAFFQDDFKVNPNLTLNVGLRWDVEQEPNETRWNGSNFDLVTGQALSMRSLGTNRIQATKWHNFGPRVGLAWKPGGSKTVVRSSYGLFYTPLTGRATSAFDRWPKSQQVTLQSSGIDPALLVSQAPPVVGSSTGYGLSHTHDEVNAPVGYFEQWNFDLQRQIFGNTLLQATYVGSAGKHLYNHMQYNEMSIDAVRAYSGGSQARRPYPNFANVGDYCECQGSTYHALELSAEKRYSRGLTFLLSYTWSKLIDQEDENFSSLFPMTSYNRRLEKGLSLATVPKRFVFSSVYDLPFGKNRSYLNSGPASRILGGWQFGGILLLQSGQQVWIYQSNNTAQTFSQQFRPNLVGDPILPADQRTLKRWFNTSAFVAPAPMTLGNSSKTPGIEGPGWINLDFALHRSIRIPLREQTRVELRGECFNCFNRANFNPPVGVFGTATFGQVTVAQSGRVLQVAVKFWF